jgi:hypothetical protein
MAISRRSSAASTNGLAVLGPGLVGSYLGAAAGADLVGLGPHHQVRARRARLPVGERTWNPRPIANPAAHGVARAGSGHPASPIIAGELAHRPVLVACRSYQRPPWALPAQARAAQNGLGLDHPVIVCFFALDEIAPGVVAAQGPPPLVVLDAAGPLWTPVLDAWQSCGITVEIVGDVRPAQWEKTILNATVGPLCLATGLDMATVWDDPLLRRRTLEATREGETIARAAGIAMPAGITERAERFFALVGGHQPSVVRDAGELPMVLGALLAAARLHGVPCPALQGIHAHVERTLRSRCLNVAVGDGRS